jgi:hypothetical protein
MESPEKYPRKGMISIGNTIGAISEKTRREIATRGLIRTYIAISNAL